MSRLDTIENELNNRIKSGALTQEDAQKVFNLALEKYADELEDGEEVKENANDGQTEFTSVEAAIDYVKNYIMESNLSKDHVSGSDLPTAPEKHTNENAPGEVAKNDANTKRVLSKAAEEVKVDMKKAEGINESSEDLMREINDLRLAVFEAAEAGAIDAETKANFLWHLDLNNWETGE